MATSTLKTKNRDLKRANAELRQQNAALSAEAFAYRLLLEHVLTLTVAAGIDVDEARQVLQAHGRTRHLRAVKG